ncbi:glycosyltransferase [Pseudoalteromonas sp. TB43-MNA-CIBAN-0091]|uniref:glycosyltransferase n=1 Tax=Pseudoalteromonas sp. TB43-MNA-CIBAN-0091 TaxID=3140416 RepID=UPI003306A4D1
MKTFKVAHLTSVHPRYDTRIFIKMCRSLSHVTQDVHLIVADGLGDEVVDGVQFWDCGERASSRFKRMIRSVRNVINKAIELDADIYHLHDPELLTYGLKLKKMGKIVIFDAHEDLPLQILSKPYLNPFVALLLSKSVSLVERYFCSRVDAVVAATPFIRDKFLKINKTVIDVNNYPILSEFSSLNKSDKFSEGSAVCYVGGITKVRGIVELVDSLSLLKKPLRLKLAGKFSEQKLERQVKKQAGWKCVSELGWLDREGIKDVLNNSFAGLVTLHPTINYKDALPVKMFEYMAAGLPVIYSNVPLWVDIINVENCGIAVDPLSPLDIAKAIDKLANDFGLAKEMGELGRKAVKEKYNWAIEEKKLLKLYRELL